MAKAYVLEFPGGNLADKREIIDRLVLPQASCAGACVFAKWAEAEPEKGRFNWADIDQRLTTWKDAGKKCVLITWGMDYGNPNHSTPEWVKQEPDYQYVTCDTYGDMPIPYAGAYKTYYRKFISQTLARYGSAVQRIDSIRFGLGLGGETYPACYYTLKGDMSADEFDQVWTSYISETTDYIDTFEPEVVLDAACNAYGDPPRLHVCDFEAADAAGRGWSFGTQGLHSDDIRNHAAGKPTGANWLQNFARYRRSPTHLQTKKATEPASENNNLPTLARFALEHGCEAFEIYLEDWRIAYDPDYEGYAEHGAAYRDAFDAIAAY
jgi:hypothetical protein